MRFNLKITVVIVIAILLISSGYYIFFISEESKDTEAPTIDNLTGNTSGTTGKITKIETTFSDNVEVTEAILHFKSASDESWRNISIINGSADIQIPSDSTENWFYYIVIDDEAGNGPIGDPSTDGSTYYTITVSNPVEDLEHFVLVEEATGTWCQYCPLVADILHELYESNEYNFYYVSLIEDKNSKAHDRCVQDYNVYGYPTVYIDGGYEVIIGEPDKSFFEEKISSAQDRDVPAISLDVSAELDNTSGKSEITIMLDNYENESYTGNLRVYLTEKISWANYDGEAYHFGFIDYIIEDEEVSIGSDGQKIITQAYDTSTLDVDNLMIVAAIFNTESTKKYSNPDSDPKTNPFDAYYADACDGTSIVEGGNLPPEIGISSPIPGKIYVRGHQTPGILSLIKYRLSNSSLNNTFLFGKMIIIAQAEDADSGIEKVEFYLNDALMETLETEPYEWTWKRLSFGKKTITVTAYDTEGKVSSTSMDVWAFIRPFLIK